MRANLAVCLLATAGAVAVSGCRSPSAANVVEVDTRTKESDLLVGNPKLLEKIGIRDVRTRVNRETGFLEVQANLVNRTNDTLRIEYSFEWYRDGGLRIFGATEHWWPKQIYGQQQLAVKAVSPLSEVETFRVTVRWPQEVD